MRATSLAANNILAINREIDSKYDAVLAVRDKLPEIELVAGINFEEILAELEAAQDFTGITVVQGVTVDWDPVNKILTVPKGDQGIQGIQGVQGVQGIQGERGFNGVQGTKGDKGDQGAEGPRGFNGTDGAQGEKGDTGDNLTVSQIVYNNDGTLTWLFSDGTSYITPNLIGPKGDTGDQGIKGDIGIGVHHLKGTSTTQAEGDFSVAGETDTYTFYADAAETLPLGWFAVTNGITLESIPTLDTVYTKGEVDTRLDLKQDLLISGDNIKTINNTSIVGPGNIEITIGDITNLQTELDGRVVKNTNITAGTNTKITYDTKGLVTSATSLSATDIPALDTSKITTGVLSVVRGGTGVSTSTGSGNTVLSTSPTLVTPNIGVATGTSFNSITGLSSTTPVVAGTAAIGTGTTTARADHVHPAQTITLTGDITGTGTGSFATTLANSGVIIGTYKSVTVDAKGRVTGGTNPTTLTGFGITDAYTKTEVDNIIGNINSALDTINGQVI